MLMGVHDKSENRCSECELKSSVQNQLAVHAKEEHTIEILAYYTVFTKRKMKAFFKQMSALNMKTQQ